MRNPQMLKGFLHKLADREPELASALLTEAVKDPVLGVSFPDLQSSVPIDADGVERLRASLALGRAPIEMFRLLAWGRVHETVTPRDLKDLIERIATKPNGTAVGLDIVFFRLFGDKEAKRAHEPEVIEAGLALLETMKFDDIHARLDHELRLIVSACVDGPGGEAVAAKLCHGLELAVANREAQIGDYHDLFAALCKVQPQIVLDSFFGGDDRELRGAVRMARSFSPRGNPFDTMPEDEIFAWCDLAPETRYVLMASVVSYLQGSEEEPGSPWSAIALRMMDRAPDPVAIAQVFAKRFRPSGGSGSMAATLESRGLLLTELEQHRDPRLVEFARAERPRLAIEVDSWRKWEADLDRQRNERFE
jgi:hypothetical protein